MMPLRKPTATNEPTPVRETFTWPPSTDELDAIEVIVLDPQPPARTGRKADLAQWGLTLTSVTAIVVALALQFVSWRSTPNAAPPAATAAAPAASEDRTAALAMATPAVVKPAAGLAPPTQAVTTPPTRRPTIGRPAPAFVPLRKPRHAERRRALNTSSPNMTSTVARTTIDSPPLRLPESYVQPRLVSSGDRGRVRGKVVLGVQVRANGRVGDVDVLSADGGNGDRDLERAAVAAVKQWRYRPALRDGVPTPARLKVIVKFS